MNTVVSQWTLVCDKDWITSVITTIQMAGLLTGGFLSGHLADFIGRKPTYFLSFILMTIFNIVAAFSISWQMFAICRFFIGFATSCYITVFFTFLAEFTPSKWRPIIMSIPGWPVWAAMYGVVSWWLHDWSHIQIATAVISAPWILAFFFVPESFRWLISHNKFNEAEKVLVRITSMNNKPAPDISTIKALAKEEFIEEQKGYTIIDVCTNWKQAKYTFLVSVTWLCCGYGYYAIAFGVQELSGDLYLNMFLLSIVEAPAQFITWFFNNYFGRKKTSVGFFLLAGVAALAVGTVELTVTDDELKGSLKNGFALTAKLGVAAAWAAIMVLGSELYPTVTRNISYGINNSMSRVGGMIAPQIVYISQKIPGVMYFLCGACMLLSALCSVALPETKGRVMNDMILRNRAKKSDLSGHSNVEMENVLKLENEKNYM